MSNLDDLKAIVNQATELSKNGQYRNALQLIDESIADVGPENRPQWTRVLSRHGAAISRSAGDDVRTRRYCEQVILCEPEDATARYVLADVLRRQGEADLARQQAQLSYVTAKRANTPEANAIVELILRTWPDFGELGDR